MGRLSKWSPEFREEAVRLYLAAPPAQSAGGMEWFATKIPRGSYLARISRRRSYALLREQQPRVDARLHEVQVPAPAVPWREPPDQVLDVMLDGRLHLASVTKILLDTGVLYEQR